MANVALINENNIVINVIVVSDDIANPETFASELLGGVWLLTDENGILRKNYAGIGYSYDEALDAFIPPKCHENAILNEDECKWSCNDASHQRIEN